MQYRNILLKIHCQDNRIVCKETETMNNRYPKPSSTLNPCFSFPPPSFWDFACKPVFPLSSIGCHFVLYKPISGRPNSLKHTQEGLLLLWLQKVCFICFILSFRLAGSDSHCSSALSATMSITDFQAVQEKKKKGGCLQLAAFLPSSSYIQTDCLSNELS